MDIIVKAVAGSHLFGLNTPLSDKDFLKDNEEDFNALDKSERKQVTRYLNGQIGNLIRPNFNNIVDGEY